MQVIHKLAEQAKSTLLTANQLGQLADAYQVTRAERLVADKIAANLKKDESIAEALLIEQMRIQEITAAGGSLLRVSIGEPDLVPTVKDWTAFYAHIQATGDFSLLERRPGKAACRERWDAGEQVPGVDQFPVYKLSRNEVK